MAWHFTRQVVDQKEASELFLGQLSPAGLLSLVLQVLLSKQAHFSSLKKYHVLADLLLRIHWGEGGRDLLQTAVEFALCFRVST